MTTGGTAYPAAAVPPRRRDPRDPATALAGASPAEARRIIAAWLHGPPARADEEAG